MSAIWLDELVSELLTGKADLAQVLWTGGPVLKVILMRLLSMVPCR